MRGKTGAARIALQTRCPVVPVVNWGAQAIIGPYESKPDLLPIKEVIVRAGAPVDLADGFIQNLYVHMGFHPAWKYREVHELLFEDGRLLHAQDRSAAMASNSGRPTRLRATKTSTA